MRPEFFHPTTKAVLREVDRPTALPNCIVIGAIKCGTTSLHFYLQQHPQIMMSHPKELNYFIKSRNWFRGKEWYRSHFPAHIPVRGETSPLYTALSMNSGVPQRMHALIPEAKLIYIVRDPIERLRSHYCHTRLHTGERRPFEQALEQNPLLLGATSYHSNLKRFLHVYPREQILILCTENLKSTRESVLRDIFLFLGVDPGFTSLRFKITSHATRFKRVSPYHRHLYLFRLRQLLRKYAPFELSGPLYWLLTLPITRPMTKPVLNNRTVERIKSLLQQEIDDFRQLAQMDFNHWTM